MNPCSDEIAKPTNKGKLPKTKRGNKREREEALPENCTALMNNIISENGGETQSCTYQHKTERGGGKTREEREMEHSIDYLIMHFIISVTIECLLSCPVYSCSCSSAALMRKIKNNHNRVTFTSTYHHITSCYSITHTHTQGLAIMCSDSKHLRRTMSKNNAARLVIVHH